MKRLVKVLVSLLVHSWDVAVSACLNILGRTARPRCVVIYYHAITPAQRAPFARQMDALLRVAWPVRADLSGISQAGAGARFAAVTFDDGFVSVLDHALPELERRNIPATMFVPSGCLGGPPPWVKPGSPASRECVLNSQQLAALKRNPVLSVGSHSISHPDFLKLEPGEARRQLEQSKTSLEAVLGEKISLFSFPHGRCSAEHLRLAREAGYQRVFTIEPVEVDAVRAPNEFVTGRVAVDPGDWELEFRLKLLGAYRWLARTPRRKSNQKAADSALSQRPVLERSQSVVRTP